MALFAIPVLVSVATAVVTIATWLLEMAIVYGKKIAFFGIAVSLFFGILYTVSTFLFAAMTEVSGSTYFSNVTPYLTLVYAIFPSNFVQLSSLIISIEFQIFFWRWAMKVLDLKVNFFG